MDDNRMELAEAINRMNYRELLEVARELHEMNADDNSGLRDMTTKYGMAETLTDWAEAVLEEAAPIERPAKAA